MVKTIKLLKTTTKKLFPLKFQNSNNSTKVCETWVSSFLFYLLSYNNIGGHVVAHAGHSCTGHTEPYDDYRNNELQL